MEHRLQRRAEAFDIPPSPAFDAMWAAFRRRWFVLQTVSWMLAWPLLISLLLMVRARTNPLCTVGAVAVLFLAAPLWVTFLGAAGGLESTTVWPASR